MASVTVSAAFPRFFMTTPRVIRGLYLALLSLFASSGWAALPAGAPAIPGVTTRSSVVGAGVEVLSNYFIAANGNTYDYVLLTGTSASVTADAAMGQITRVLFIDLDDDIVTIEFSGAGSLMVTLANATGPALPLKYNPAAKFGQPLNYMKGHAAITVTGANATTNVSVFSVGRATEVDQTIFRDSEVYDGVADISRVTIVADPANSNFTPFGSLRLANAICSASSGVTGILAANVAFNSPVFIGDIKAYDTAIPALQLGSASDTRIVGGNLLQPNGKPIIASGINNLVFVAGATSHGATMPAQTNQGQLSQAPALTSGSSASFTVGAAGSFTATATGFPAPTFSVASGTLPSWATLNATTGVISGTPSDATGSPFAFTLQASNGVGSPASQSFTLTVLGSLAVVPLSNQTVTAGSSATWTASASGGGTLTYQWRRDGQPLAGATNATYAIGAVTMLDAGWYDVVVSRGASQVVSGAAFLSVAPTKYPGTMRVDPAFTPEIEAEGGSIYALVQQSDGRLIVGGQFSKINGVKRENLARLNLDGSVDPTFEPGAGPNGIVRAMALQPDGKLLLAGEFRAYNGIIRGRVARVNTDGTLDASFATGPGADSAVLAIGRQSDGKILLAGYFANYDGAQRTRMVRVNADGSLDSTFSVGAGFWGSPNAFAVQADGRILVSGSFTQYNGTSRPGVARLNPDGALDSTFVPNVVAGSYPTLAVQGDGKVVVGGDNYSGSVANLVRLNADGSRDTSFAPAWTRQVAAVVVQADGKIVAGGWFSESDGTARSHLARYLADGTLDPAFDAGTEVMFIPQALLVQPDGGIVTGGTFTRSTSAGPYRLVRVQANGARDVNLSGVLRSRGLVTEMLRQRDGKLLLAGGFDYVNGAPSAKVARLNTDGTVDAAFNVGRGAEYYGAPESAIVGAMVLQPDGRIIIGGVFASVDGVSRARVARLNANGSLDPTFDPGAGPNFGPLAMAQQPDGKILLIGEFNSDAGTPRSHVARVNADGSLDASFNFGGNTLALYCLAVQNDGRILLGGIAGTFSGTTYPGIVRLTSDGSLDASFASGLSANDNVWAIGSAPDGKTLVSTNSYVRRLQANGSMDGSFASADLSSTLYMAAALLRQADGRWLAGRSYKSAGSLYPPPPGITRLGSDGSTDLTFGVPGLRDAAFSRMIPLEDGRLLVAGTRFSDGTVDQAGVARLTWPTPPVITTADHAAFSVGFAGSFTVAASGVPAPTFAVISGNFPSWASLNRTTGVISGTPPGATGSPFTFTVQASTGAETVATQTFTLTVGTGSAVITPLQNQTAAAGSSFTWNASVTGAGPFTYQWRREGRPIAGATAASYTIPATTMLDAGYYDVVVADGAGLALASNAAVLDVAPTRYPGAMRIDPTFAPVIEATGGTVSSIARQADGKFIVGGSFSRINGVARRNLARLNANGDVDTLFDAGTGPDGAVYEVLLQSDGKVLLAGDFLSCAGVARGHIARLNADGGLDSSFETGAGANDRIEAIALQTDGRILVAGWFTSYAGVSRNRILRVNTDGSLDSTFDPSGGFSGGVYDLAVQVDGKIVVGGSFVQFDGVVCNGVARLLPSGARDASFVPATGSDLEVRAVVVQADGKILAGADSFSTSLPALLRLNGDGSRDTGFSPISVRGIDAVALQDDGKILIGGSFGSYNGAPRNNVARLTSSGALDTTFDAGAGPDFQVAAVVVQPNGQPVVGGRSLLVEDSRRSAIARLKTTGVLDVSFAGDVRSPGSVAAFVRQADGKVLIGGFFDYVNGVSHKRLARINADGLLDAAFNPSVTLVGGVTGAGTKVEALAVQDDGKIVLSGFFDRVNGHVRNRLARLLPDGATDTSFDSSSSVVGDLSALAVQPDGKVIVFGFSLQSYGGVPRSRIARLNSNGSLDLSFDPKGGLGANSILYSIVKQPDGRVLLGGWFDSYDGVTRHGVARILSDGSLDSGFGANNGLTTSASGLLLAPDGKIYVGGSNRITHLNADGSIDSSYAGANLVDLGSIGPMIRQADGRLLAGQAEIGTNVPTIGIDRVKADGSHDETFRVQGIAEAHFSAMSLLEDGNLLVSGGIFTDGTVSQAGLARFVHVQPATLSSQPQTQTGVVGGPVTLSVTATGDGPFTYQWRKGGAAIPGATGSTFTIDVLASGDAGNYTVDVTNLAGTTTSGVAVLTVNPAVPPTIVTQPLSQSVSLGAGFTLHVVPGGSAPFTYQWYLGATPLPGASHDSYTVAAPQASDAGSYTVVVTNVADSITSNAAIVTILTTGFSGTHAVVGPGYAPGQTVTITNTITYAGELSALGWQVLLPANWSYASGGGAAADLAPRAGDTGFLEWAWTAIPTSPITFTYKLNVPAGTTGAQAIAALMLPRQAGTQHTLLVKPDALVIEQVTRHSADTDGDGRLSLNELLRVIELYNTRNGTVRTGAYAIDANNLEDGFTTAPARLNTASVTLAKYHSSDSNHDGKLDLNELLRVIELYNHRNGTVRTGQYHVQANTEDGFASGP